METDRMTSSSPTRRTHTAALELWAADDPAATCVVVVNTDGTESAYSVDEVLRATRRVARALASSGVDHQSTVLVALPNGLAHVVASYAAWWLGACVAPLSTQLPVREREQIIEGAQSAGRQVLVIGDLASSSATSMPVDILAASAHFSHAPLPERIPSPGRAMPSGGSTGRPKLIVDPNPWVGVSSEDSPKAQLLGRRPGQTVLVIGPMYHTGPSLSVFSTIFDRGKVVIMERFDATLALDLIDRHRVNWLFSVPTQLLRMARSDRFASARLTSIEALYHSGASCPVWLKRTWIERLGGHRVIEGYGATEQIGAAFIRGDEWLRHPGSVGKPMDCDVEIRDPDGTALACGQVGQIFMRRHDGGGTALAGQRSTYWGTPDLIESSGFVTIGDLGWIDDDGYLFIADRRVDMIVSGGANVFPAEVEAALSEHPVVRDVAVIGLPDDEWGHRVHAIVAVADPSESLESELRSYCRARIAPAKVPKTIEFVESLPRNDAGKLRRTLLVDQRLNRGVSQ